jgi:hypothetical protein
VLLHVIEAPAPIHMAADARVGLELAVHKMAESCRPPGRTRQRPSPLQECRCRTAGRRTSDRTPCDRARSSNGRSAASASRTTASNSTR